ncbi:SAM-dependent methyltransferase [Nocardia puris]|uniref:SAM-dependent methyltransferase n=1 Tax=Nocardia puris TaxID=208602 RepID=UPI002B4B00A1|nr:SAM-dependent methyltransferase [Nocardia puris]
MRECGIRQILDIGPGLPGMSNTHEVAQGIEPSARVVYVDSDPLVLTHARALLTSTTPEGVVGVVDADLRDSAGLLAAAYATLEPGEPVAILLMGVLGYVSWDEARYAVQALRAAVPDGSYLAIWDGVTTCEAHTRWWDLYPETGATPYRLTSPAGLESLFSGTELVTPGVVPIDRWRPTRTRFTGDRGALPAQGGLGRIHGGRAW